MVLFKSSCLAIFFLFSSFLIPAQQSVNSILINKPVNETPLSEYVSEPIKGKQLLLLIAYGCHHCREATEKAITLKNKGLIDSILILGSEAGEANSKKEFIEQLPASSSYLMIDYDWNTFPKKLITPEPKFPNPPVIFYIINNQIIKIYTEVPSEASLKKIKAKIEKD